MNIGKVIFAMVSANANLVNLVGVSYFKHF